jgi:hypothetical protein
MSTPLLCLLAAGAMIAQDLLLTWMVQAEARNLWVLAGILDSVGFLAQVTTYGVSIGAIITYGLTARTVWVLVALTAANFIGTGLGTKLGSRWIHAASIVDVAT